MIRQRRTRRHARGQAARLVWLALPIMLGVTSVLAAPVIRPIQAIFNPLPPGTDRYAEAPDSDSFARQPVATRRRPDYDPPGEHISGFLLFPSLDIETKYDDNIFATSNDRAGDFATIFSPALSVESTWSRHGLGLQAFGEFSKFLDHQSEDTQQGGVNLTGRFDIATQDYLSGFASFSHEAEDRSEPDDAGRRQPTLFDRYIASTRYAHRFSRLELRIDGQLERFDYMSEFDADRDRLELEVAPRLAYHLSSYLTPFIQAGYLNRQFDAFAGRNGRDPDSQTYDAIVGLNFSVDPTLSGDIGVGLFRTEFDDSTLAPITSPAVDGSFTWNVTRLTTIQGQVFRREAVASQTDTSSKIVTAVSLRVDHELLRSVLLGAEIDFRNEEFQGDDRIDNRVDLRVEGKYLINRNVSVDLGYQYTNRNSNVASADLIENVFRVGVDFHM
jgi:hypothetical protein